MPLLLHQDQAAATPTGPLSTQLVCEPNEALSSFAKHDHRPQNESIGTSCGQSCDRSGAPSADEGRCSAELQSSFSGAAGLDMSRDTEYGSSTRESRFTIALPEEANGDHHHLLLAWKGPGRSISSREATRVQPGCPPLQRSPDF